MLRRGGRQQPAVGDFHKRAAMLPASFVQAPARDEVLHPPIGAWIEERDEALLAYEVPVADRTQRNRRRLFQCVAVVEEQLETHAKRDALLMRDHPNANATDSYWPT